jgi:hypothetical protein
MRSRSKVLEVKRRLATTRNDSQRLTPLRALVQALHDPRCKVPPNHPLPADRSGAIHKHPYIVHLGGIPPPRSVQEGIQPFNEDYTVSGQDRIWGWRRVFPRVIECGDWDSFGRVGGEGESERSEESEIRGEVECECCALCGCVGQLESSSIHGTRLMFGGKNMAGIGGLDVLCASALRQDQGTRPALHGTSAIRQVPRRWLTRRPPVLGEMRSPLRRRYPSVGELEEVFGGDAS